MEPVAVRPGAGGAKETSRVSGLAPVAVFLTGTFFRATALTWTLPKSNVGATAKAPKPPPSISFVRLSVTLLVV